MPNKKYGIRTIQKQHGGTGKYVLSQYVSMAPGVCFNAGTRSCMSNTRVRIQEAELLYMTYSTAKNKKEFTTNPSIFLPQKWGYTQANVTLFCDHRRYWWEFINIWTNGIWLGDPCCFRLRMGGLMQTSYIPFLMCLRICCIPAPIRKRDSVVLFHHFTWVQNTHITL